MLTTKRVLAVTLLTLFCATSSAVAVQPDSAAGKAGGSSIDSSGPAVAVRAEAPPVVGEDRSVRIEGSFRPEEGKSPAAAETVRFAVYSQEVGGRPLWEETRSVVLDAEGRYSVVLGGGSFPMPESSTGDQLWLGVHFLSAGDKEQTRTVLSHATAVATSLREGAEMPKPGHLPAAPPAPAPVAVSSSRTPLVSNGTPGKIAKFTTNVDEGDSVMFESAGKIGLGNLAPVDALHVTFTNTTGTQTGYAVQNLGATAASYSGNLFYDQAGATSLFQGFNNSTHEYRINNVASSGSINFMLASSSKFLVQAGSGYIGVSQPTPTYPLDVLHTGSTGLRVKSSGSFSTIDIDAASGDAALRFANAGVNQWNIRNRPADNYLEIFELGGGGSRMVIQDGTGNVGIGQTTNPTYKLDVLQGGGSGIHVGSTSSFTVIDLDSANGDSALRFQKAGVNQWNIRNNPANNDLQFYELGASERMRIENTTGRVVIATNLLVNGTFTAVGAKSFTINHPLDPENKILRHAAAESDEVINFYSGNVTTDENGRAVVALPEYFGALNKDPRYNLTVIGVFAQAIVSKEVESNRFEIATSQPNVKVSWEVKAVRNDAYMQQNPFRAVEAKNPAEDRPVSLGGSLR